MNREIKFRGKSIMNNTCGDWLYSSGIKYGDDVELMYCDEDTSEEWNYIDKETLGQYTGLDDKNGKEIFEGDIVKQVSYKYSNDEYGHKGFYENISKVLYKGRAFQYEWIKTNEIEMPKDFKENFIEVIGNIYDNPELLGGK